MKSEILAGINAAQVHLAYCCLLLNDDQKEECQKTLLECIDGATRAAAKLKDLIEEEGDKDI